MSERARLLAARLADDELVLGWRDSEWTGIAPFLEEDVAFSSIAQNEIGHARALYELAAASSARRRRARVRPRAGRVPLRAARRAAARLDWARTIARHWLYETADALRLEALKASADPEVAGLAAKIDREEAYHRMHAEMWAERPRGDEPRFARGGRRALAVRARRARRRAAARRARASARRPAREVEAVERGAHTDELAGAAGRR